MADSATVKLKGDKSDLDAALEGSQASLQAWANKAATIAKGVAVFFAAKKLFAFGADMVAEALEAEKGQAILVNTLKNLGDRAAMTQDQVNKFATDLSKVTTFGDDALISVQALFLRLGTLDSTAIQRATKASADLATVMGTDIEAAGAKLTRALKDPEQGIAALRQAGIKFTDQEKEMVKALSEAGNEAAAQEIILKKLEGAIGGAAEQMGKTAGGQMEILKNRFGEISESIGAALIPVLSKLMPYLESFAGWIETVGVPAIEWIIDTVSNWAGVMTDVLGVAFKWLTDAAVLTFTVVETAIDQFVNGAKLAFTAYALHVVSSFEIVKHYLTEVIPGYLSWFGRNWMQIFKAAGDYLATVFSNMWTNVSDFFKGLRELLSGGNFSFEITPLTKGFQSTLEKLPKIGERVKGDLEKGLEISRDKLVAEIGNAFDANLKKNRVALGLDDGIGGTPGDVTKKTRAELLAEAGKTGGTVATKDGKGFVAGFEDLISLNKRISAASAGTKDDKTEAAIKAAREKAAADAKIAEEQRKEAIQQRAETNRFLNFIAKNPFAGLQP